MLPSPCSPEGWEQSWAQWLSGVAASRDFQGCCYPRAGNREGAAVRFLVGRAAVCSHCWWLAAAELVGMWEGWSGSEWLLNYHKVNNCDKIPWPEHPKGHQGGGQLPRAVGPCGGSPGQDQTDSWRGSDLLTLLWAEAESLRSEALSWLLSSLFPPLVSPPQCSLSLSQWQEELAGPEMALLLWGERDLVVQVVTQET